jgi:Ca2+-binding RTX toxin-like protein
VAAAAGAGAETLTGAGSSGTLAFFGGAGVDLLAGGSGNTALVAGFGGGTLAGGSGATLFEFADGITHGADIITGWNAAKDYLELTGYAVNNSGVLANATIANGSTSFSLSDGTQVTLVGVTDPTTINFYTPAPTTKM